MKSNNNIPLTWIWLALVLIIPTLSYIFFKSAELPKKYFRIEGWYNSDTSEISHYQFLDQDSTQISLSAFPGQILDVNFFYTYCPDLCPKMMHGLEKVSKFFYGNNKVHFLSFTVDPDHDRPGVLKKYAEELNINPGQWQLLTGDKRKIYRTARTGFKLVASEGDGGPFDFIHSDKEVLVDTHGNIRGYYNGIVPNEMDNMIQDIKGILNE